MTKAWFKFFLPIAALIAAVFLLYARVESERQFNTLVEAEQGSLKMAEQRLVEVLTDAAVDLRVIAGTPAVRAYVDGESDAQEQAEALFSSYVREDWTYDQIRLIDAAGMERVRVNRVPEGAQIVRGAGLQDKRGRDYVTETLKLLGGQTWVSALELNVEHGAIEVPHRPVLRMAMRVDAGSNRQPDVLVANLRGAVLLKGLQDFAATTRGELWLLDRDGYWVMHPDPRMAWGRQLDPTRSIKQRVPLLAAQLDHVSGVLRTDDALYVHHRVEPLARQLRDGLVASAPSFDLVSRTPADELPSALPVDLWLPLAVVLLIAAVGSALLAQQRVRSA